MHQMKSHWHGVLGIIKRVTSKTLNAQEDSLSTLYRALLEAKITWAYNYPHLFKAQDNQLEILNNKTMRVITGPHELTELFQL